ncbi:hypothetical protein BH11PSE12_BH11PSE12_00140 [soil metagenome]
MTPVLLQARNAGTLIIALSTAGNLALASDTEPSSVPASLRVGIEKLTLPGHESMGMFGSTYLIETVPGIFLGPAAYGAVTGKRGGFFTVGGELAWRYQLANKVSLNTGLYVGGGGGGTALVGGGLMLRPHADLMWDFGGYRAGISASNVRFPNGSISSNQIGLLLDFDTSFVHTSAAANSSQAADGKRSGVGFDRAMILGGIYKPSSSSTYISGKPMLQSIKYAGMRMERMLTPYVFAGIEATGAGSGGDAGYAEYLANIGAETPVLDNNISLGTRVGLGMGGGGSISVGGGILAKAGVYATANLSRNLHVSLEGGVTDAPNGHFRTKYASVALHWDLDHPYSNATSSSIVANEWVAGTQHYVKAARKDGSKRDIDSVTLKLNRYLSDSMYITGQAHSAYSGYAGGYSAGLIGLGYRSPKKTSNWYAGAELLAGAAGGGGVDTSGGFMTQPNAYVGVDINKSLSARLNVGRVKSIKGTLNSNVIEVGLSYAFNTTSRD